MLISRGNIPTQNKSQWEVKLCIELLLFTSLQCGCKGSLGECVHSMISKEAQEGKDVFDLLLNHTLLHPHAHNHTHTSLFDELFLWLLLCKGGRLIACFPVSYNWVCYEEMIYLKIYLLSNTIYTYIDRYITTAKALKICEVCRMNGAFPRHVSTSLYFSHFSRGPSPYPQNKTYCFSCKALTYQKQEGCKSMMRSDFCLLGHW